MTRVHVWGAAGYAAAEAVRYVRAHPYLELGVLESRSHAGAGVGDHFPLLRTLDRKFDGPGAVLAWARPGDAVVTASGQGEAAEIVGPLLSGGVRVVDLSADYRFDAAAAYGLPEFFGEAIAGAPLVANPGCYPTAAALALLPLADVATPLAVAIDAKSGISGAGRNPSVGALFAEVAGDVRAYGLSGHRHQAEIERNLRSRGIAAPVAFTPHVVPLARGMLVDCYAVFAAPVDAAAVRAAYLRAYAGSPFVRVLDGDRTPSVSAVNGTNAAELRVDALGTLVRAICAIDNLGKGAAGQAVQNLNLMLGFPQETGLDGRAVVA
ncbi:MAG TPA: N-acetyl-gamma-glutamyl-phosphate reductase [Candidatus Acidoferrales bacterium]|nr:N-acetyl-gamma-glutamyl-phosphate reductase [Candidatus Acidoferrales bacterium]